MCRVRGASLEAERPSQTALRVALRRAAHQIYDDPLVFEDPLAVTILGEAYREELRRTPVRPDRPFSTALRAFLVARSRFAEDALAAGVGDGVSQYVLLGAGLDTFAYRNGYQGLRVFEVDHTATQAWKRRLLERSGIAIPASMTFVPVDFERERLKERLAASGFQAGEKTLFACLGVVPYLTREAFRATVAFVSQMPTGSGLVMDYSQPREVLPLLEQMAHDSLAGRVRLAGEPFQLFFTPEQMREELTGFRRVEDVGSSEINAMYFAGRSDGLAVRGSAGRIVLVWL